MRMNYCINALVSRANQTNVKTQVVFAMAVAKGVLGIALLVLATTCLGFQWRLEDEMMLDSFSMDEDIRSKF